MTQLTQEHRLMAISDFGLGKDTLLLTGLTGTESLSTLFEFELSAISENLELVPESIIGKSATVTIQNKHKRCFHGYINHLTVDDIEGQYLRKYKLIMVPWLWFLKKTNNYRIFQEKTVKDIVSQIFNDHGFNDYRFNIQGGVSREYCIQHNESDYHFVSRLLQEEGMTYFFQHEQDKHTLHIVDPKNAYSACPETDLEHSTGSQTSSQIMTWQREYQFKKGQWTLNDYHFKESAKSLLSTSTTTSQFAKNKHYEHYEYPGYYQPGYRDSIIAIRQDAEEVDRNIIKGTSNCSTFYAGGRFKIGKHTTESQTGEYILVSVNHQIHDASYYSGATGETQYQNSFTCIPAEVHHRPQRLYPRPVMKGPQSAIVVGPAGEDIYTDEYGRIKVQFIWDRQGKKNESSSCWIRVMQSWAGNRWGASFTPRIGHEVIVEFLDGDPDRPLVIGTVHNDRHKPPYPSKTQSGIKSRSTKNGSMDNYNELRFDDKKGSEQILIHAENNMDTEVENDETLTVDHNRTKTIKHDEHSTIGNNRNKTVNNNQSEIIGKDKRIQVGESHTEDIGQNMTIMVGDDLTESVNGQYMEKVIKEYGLQAKSITLQADERITLKTGSATMVMKSNGDITLSGATINIKGSGPVNVKGSKVSEN